MIIFKKIRWKNFLSTGNNFTEIDLHVHNKTIIIGKNSFGKSTLLDALTFSLFNKPFRKINLLQLVNTINNKDCVVEIEFSIGNNEYLVKRGLKPKIFEIYKNGSKLDENSAVRDQQYEFEKNILQMNYNAFTQVVILGSSNFTPFMQLTANNRRELIEDLLDIKIFSVMNTILKSKIFENNQNLLNVDSEFNIISERYNLKCIYINKLEEKLTKDIESIKQKIINYEVEINKLRTISYESEIEELKKNKECNEVEKRKYEEMLRKIDIYINQVNSKIKDHKKYIEFFEKNNNCYTCGQNIPNNFKNSAIEISRSSIEDCNNKLFDISKEYNRVNNKIKSIQNCIDDIEKNIKIVLDLNKEKMYNINTFEKYIRELNESLVDITNSENIDIEKEELTSIKNDLEIIKKEKSKFLNKKEIYGIIVDLLKDNGIKSQIIKQYLPLINKFVNQYLSDMNFFAEFHLDETFKETIKSRYRDSFSYDSFSEGEKLRIDLAILFTWRMIAKLKNSLNTNLLILDEIFDSSLDEDGIDEFMKIINSVCGKNLNVFIISHKVDQLQDKFDYTIKFNKRNNFSEIEIKN